MDIIQSIYKSCDEANTNSVHVWSLIDFIKPYMSNNLSELDELQTLLDPDNNNRCVNYSFFESVMSDWIAKLQGGAVYNSFSEFPASFYQTFCSEISNVKSNVNNNDFDTIKNTLSDDTLEDQVGKLKFQLNKTSIELELAKQQLAFGEEQNEALLTELKKLHQLHQRNEDGSESKCFLEEDENFKQEEVDKREQLQKMLKISEQQQEMYLAQMQQLENENLILKNKLQTFAKMKQEDRNSVIEMRDSLNEKETEICTLVEVINNLKCKLEEKDDLLNFHTKEHELLNQRVHELESFLQNNTSHNTKIIFPDNDYNFNTPNLLNQITHPVSPILNFTEFDTSSPVKNLFLESGNSSDFFNMDVVQTVVKSPRKSLKEELSEVNVDNERNDSLENSSLDSNIFTVLRNPQDKLTLDEGENHTDKEFELKRLHKLMKHQEYIKNSLWQTMKVLLNDVANLKDYKRDYHLLLKEAKEMEEKIKKYEETHRPDILEELLLQITDIEINLNKQRDMNRNIKDDVKILGDSLNRNENEIMNELNSVKRDLDREKWKNFNLLETLLNHKVLFDKSVETEKQETACDVKSLATSEHLEQKKTNFDRQRMRIERLLEKQEIIEKEFSIEKAINVRLTLKLQEANTKILQIEDDFKSCKNKGMELEETVTSLISEKSSFLDRINLLENVNMKLQLEVAELKAHSLQLTKQNFRLNEELTNALATVTCLHAEKNHLINIQLQMEKKIKEDFVIKKELIDSRTADDETIQQLQSDLEEMRNEILNLKTKSEVNVESTVSALNSELKSAILNATSAVNFDENMIQDVVERSSGNLNKSENEIFSLECNIRLIISLVRNLSEKCNSQQLLIFSESSCENELSSNENSASESSSTEIDISNIIPVEYDSFLENLCLNDTDLQLSPKQVEEKFATLALVLTVDGQTSETRCIREEKRFNRVAFKFLSSLNRAVSILNSNKGHRIYKHLKIMRDLSEDMLRLAFKCGILYYEKRTVNYWKLLMNYIASLNKKKCETRDSIDEVNLSQEKGYNLMQSGNPVNKSVIEKYATNKLLSSNLCKRTKFCVYSIFLILFGVVLFVLYINQLCFKNGKRTCPLQWITNLFIEKTYQHDL